MNNFSTMPLRFRVWDNQKQSFVTWDDNFCFARDEDDNISLYEIDWYAKDLVEQDHDRYIISQDTGFKDKNGESVCTGDIVKSWDEVNGVVYYDQDLLQVRVKFADADDEDLPSCEAEKIGNIWQNPELLEG